MIISISYRCFHSYRVSSDQENLENLEMSGNFDSRRKSQGIFKKHESQGSLLFDIHFSQSEHTNFLNFLSEHTPRSP